MSEPNKPLVTTIIPVFNRRELLRQSVNSVLAQTYRPIEIIVVDDGSSEEYLTFYKALENEIEELTLLSQKNTGPGGARELGRTIAKGEFIQYLDSDDVLFENKFADQVAQLQVFPECIACYGVSVQYVCTSEILSDEDLCNINQLLPMRDTAEMHQRMFPQLLKSRWWTTSTPLFRSAGLEKIGPWSDLVNEEDWEYEARLAGEGGLLCRVQSNVSVRLIHGEQLSSHGAIDKHKLASRARARESIYQSAKQYEGRGYEPVITDEHWDFFGRNAFLLARQCASQGLDDEYHRLMHLSAETLTQQSVSFRLFGFFARTLGSLTAARLAQFLGK